MQTVALLYVRITWIRVFVWKSNQNCKINQLRLTRYSAHAFIASPPHNRRNGRDDRRKQWKKKGRTTEKAYRNKYAHKYHHNPIAYQNHHNLSREKKMSHISVTFEFRSKPADTNFLWFYYCSFDSARYQIAFAHDWRLKNTIRSPQFKSAKRKQQVSHKLMRIVRRMCGNKCSSVVGNI